MKKRNFRLILSVLISKLAFVSLRLLGRDASHFPGVVALKLCPDFLDRIDKPATVIAVTGTNGKTTVTNMIYNLLSGNGYKVLCNRAGSNTYTGIASVLLQGASLSGRSRYETAVLEVDERSSPLIYPYVTPDYLVCTNLFRDSLTRNAHTEFIKGILDNSIPKSTKLILNGDDLISCNLAPGNERVFFGIDRQPGEREEENLSCDLRVCPQCFLPLVYDFKRYHHIGRAHCPNCGFASPDTDYRVTSIDSSDMTLTMTEKNGAVESYVFPNRNIINIYNFLAVVAFARCFGISADDIRLHGNISVVGSRYSETKLAGKEVLMTLSKAQNPIACSRAFSYADKLEGTKSVVLLLDEIEGTDKMSENICWLYDADFELLAQPDVRQVIAVGARHLDDKVRLLIAGVDADKLITTSDYGSVSSLVDISSDRIVVLYDLHCVATARALKNALEQRLKGDGER